MDKFTINQLNLYYGDFQRTQERQLTFTGQ